MSIATIPSDYVEPTPETPSKPEGPYTVSRTDLALITRVVFQEGRNTGLDMALMQCEEEFSVSNTAEACVVRIRALRLQLATAELEREQLK